jgi:protein TonB
MPLQLALLTSLALHALLIIGPIWLAAQPPPPPAPSIAARLLPPPVPETIAEAVSTTASPADALPQPPAVHPRRLQGAALQRAQTALSRHLFYPPQAVVQGLEGEVILLLSLTENGRLISASVASSSGHTILDQAALDAARQIGALPGNPRQTLFPVRFRLQ